MAKDVNFSNVVLLMHMDGADNGTTFADVRGKTVSVFGNTATKTAQKKFGTASVYFDGAGDYLSIPNTSDFDFGSGDLTVEAWVYLAGDSTPDNDGSRGACVCATWATDPRGWVLSVVGDTSTTGTGISFDTWSTISQGSGTLRRATCSISKNAWHHIAATVSGGVTRLFLDGVSQTWTTITVGGGYTQANSGASALTIGKTAATLYPLTLNGYIDDLRITKGVARYTANFTPPTEPFPNGRYEVGGTVLDINGNPVARTFRAYRRDTGALLGTGVSNASTGTYNIEVDHSGEVQVVMLDDAGGSIENDQILRTTPV